MRTFVINYLVDNVAIWWDTYDLFKDQEYERKF